MSKRRLVNRCLMGAVLAVPSALFGIYSMGFAQEPPSAALPSEASLRPILRIAQAEAKPAGGNMDMAAWDVPGGMALDPNAKKWQSVGVGDSCIRCHAAKSGPSIQLPGFNRPDGPQDDGWCLLNEAATWATRDKHYGSYVVLLNDRSQQMAKVLGIVDENGKSQIHRDLRCIACHSGVPLWELDVDENHSGLITEEMVKEETLNRGVSCEGCHGPAGGTDNVLGWETKHISKREWRFLDPKVKAETYGYYDVRSPVSRARMCLSCHVGNVHEGRVVTHEMYAAGHPPLPGFEVETFSAQEPAHWRDFQNKVPKVREEFLENTKEWRKGEWNENALPNTRDLLIGGCMNLSELLKLTADLSDASVKIPVGGDHWGGGSAEQWPELAQFACYACHHDLQEEGWRLKRTPIGVPGRPPLHEWPFVLAKFAVKASGDENGLVEEIDAVQKVFVDGPFGNRTDVQMKGRELANRLNALAHKLEGTSLPKTDAPKLLDELVRIARTETLDYDSARQIVWAYRVIYEDFKSISPNADVLYSDKKLEEVPGWYTEDQQLDPTQKALAAFGNNLLMDLRKGRATTEPLGQEERPVLEWQASLALPKIGAYDPEMFRKLVNDLHGLTDKENVGSSE